MFISGVRGACAREIQYLRTHPWDWALISWVPALTLAAIWAIFSAGVNTKLPLAFVDEDHSPGSRHLAIALDATRSTAIAARPASLGEAWALVRQRRVYAVLHVPHDWERRAERGDPLPVVLYTNEQYHAAGSSISTDVIGALGSVEGGRALAGLASLGGGFVGAQRRADVVHAELRSLYGPQLSFERALAGAFFPATLHLFVLGAAAFAIGREFRDRTAGAWLKSARGNVSAALVGKLLPLLCCFAVLALGVVVWLTGYRGWTANGSLLMWSAGLASLILVCCAIPAMLIGLTGTLRVALAICAITNITAISFTGFTYPLYSMTTAAKIWSQMLPFHYFYEIQQQQWNIGAPMSASLLPLAVLWGAFIIIPLAIALPRLTKRCLDPSGWGLR
jgi:ABC-2 type transport system permease protein